jgi:hypothetical protein
MTNTSIIVLAVIDHTCLRRVKLCSQRVWKYCTTLDSVCVVSVVYHGCFNVSLKFCNRVCNGIWYPSETPIQRIHMG